MSASILSFIRSLSTPLIWWVVVAPWEQAVRVRGGKQSRLLHAGIHLRIPFLDRVFVVSTRKRAITASNQTVMTLDRHPVSISIAVQFSVRDAQQMLNAISNPEQTVLTMAEAAVARVVSHTGLGDLTYDSIQGAASVSIPDDWGFSDVAVRVTAFASVRTYRLLMNDYSSRSGLDEALQKQDQPG